MEKKRFLDLKQDVQIRRCTSPQAVFVTQNPDEETYEQVVDRQENFLKLPENIKDKLVSTETAQKIKIIGDHYKLELLQMAPIARVVRSYYFGEIQLVDFDRIIEKESKISREDAQEISKYIIDRIINRGLEKVVAIKTEKMTITKAIDTYPEIRNQKLTSYSIEVNGLMKASTIGAWIDDYYNVVGAGNRDIMKRSSYLYHSKNVKNLNVSDRQKLSTVLKSLDEGLLVRVNPENREIIFDLPKRENMVKSNNDNNKRGEVIDFKNKIDLSSGGLIKNKLNGVSGGSISNQIEPENKNNKREFLNNATNINHVHGSALDLKSDNFTNKEKSINKKGFSFFSGDKKNINSENKINFSSPQQLPVEKDKKEAMKPLFERKNQENTISDKDNFFGKIGPIE